MTMCVAPRGIADHPMNDVSPPNGGSRAGEGRLALLRDVVRAVMFHLRLFREHLR